MVVAIPATDSPRLRNQKSSTKSTSFELLFNSTKTFHTTAKTPNALKPTLEPTLEPATKCPSILERTHRGHRSCEYALKGRSRIYCPLHNARLGE